MERKWMGIACVGLASLLACNVARSASQDQPQKPLSTSSEYAAFRAADEEKNSQVKIKLLDDFSMKYPNSKLKPETYRDYYLTYFAVGNYRQTVEYADKFLALGDEIDPGDRLEALTDRAQAFFTDCSDAWFQTPEAYAKAKTAAVQGLQTVSLFPIPPNGIRGDGGDSIPVREHIEALFYAVVGIAESGLKGHIHDSCISKKIEIENIRLFSWVEVSGQRRYAEFQEFREAKDLHLLPSPRFDVACDLTGEPDLSAGDFLVWTTVDFLVAPATEEYEKMGTDPVGSNIGWGAIAEMQDFGSIPIYSLQPQKTKSLVMKDFDLTKVLAAFPVGNAGNLWPWLLRLNIHVQDRTGRQIGSAQRVVRLWPDSARKMMNPSQSPNASAP